MTARNFGDRLDEFVVWAKAWNAYPLNGFYKNGKPKPLRKQPPDALAYVRTPTADVLAAWSEQTKQRVIQQLMDEEEKRQGRR